MTLVNSSPVTRLTAASRCHMSPSTEYPLAITDMNAVCQADHGLISVLLADRAGRGTSDLAAEHPILPL
jgi:hypothetical protein